MGSESQGPGLLEVGTIIWLVGIALFLLYTATTYARLKRKLMFATHVKDNVYETDQIQTPFVLGLLKPRIYLPIGLASEEMEYILQHERTHINRFDHLIKPAAFFVLVLQWFNPVVWLSYALMIKDMEMSCDEKVIKQTGNNARAKYSRTLLSLATKQSGLLGPLAFGESNVKARVEYVLYYKRPAFWVGTIVAVVLVILAIGLLLNPPTSATNVDQEDEQAVIQLVERFGKQLKLVTLSDPTDIVKENMQAHYSDYVTDRLLEEWLSDANEPPGRIGSSPWPDRIEVLNVEPLESDVDVYEVEGRIVEVSGDGSIEASRPISLETRRFGNEWFIDGSILGEYETWLTSEEEADVIDSSEPNIEKLVGYVTLQDDMLYLDPVELVTSKVGNDLYGEFWEGYSKYDPERIAELGLNEEADFPHGYHIHNLSIESFAFRLTEQTHYFFTDFHLLFVENPESDRSYTTTKRSEFVEHLTTSIRDFSGEVTYPLLIEVNGQDVISVTEIFLFTQ